MKYSILKDIFVFDKYICKLINLRENNKFLYVFLNCIIMCLN